jgi:outer membrane protein with beta-barrel domain
MNAFTIRASLCVSTVLSLALSVAARPAAAQSQATSQQEERKVGITMGFPASIGVIFHASDKVAVRPELSFSGNSTDGTSSTSTDGWSVGTGVSALFYVATHDRVRTYVSPRLTYSRITFNSSSSLPSPLLSTSSKSTGTTWGGAGSFGAQYSPTPRFSVFGEVGLGFSRQTSHSSVTTLVIIPSTDVKGNSWGTRAGVGIVFYP